MDITKIDNIEFEGIDYKDAPDFCDAFIKMRKIISNFDGLFANYYNNFTMPITTISLAITLIITPILFIGVVLFFDYVDKFK